MTSRETLKVATIYLQRTLNKQPSKIHNIANRRNGINGQIIMYIFSTSYDVDIHSVHSLSDRNIAEISLLLLILRPKIWVSIILRHSIFY